MEVSESLKKIKIGYILTIVVLTISVSLYGQNRLHLPSYDTNCEVINYNYSSTYQIMKCNKDSTEVYQIVQNGFDKNNRTILYDELKYIKRVSSDGFALIDKKGKLYFLNSSLKTIAYPVDDSELYLPNWFEITESKTHYIVTHHRDYSVISTEYSYSGTKVEAKDSIPIKGITDIYFRNGKRKIRLHSHFLSRDKVAIVENGKKKGLWNFMLYDEDGHNLIPQEVEFFDKIYLNFGQNMFFEYNVTKPIKIKKKGKYGFYGVIEPKYDKLKDLINGFAEFKVGKSKGFIDLYNDYRFNRKDNSLYHKDLTKIIYTN